jgi:adenylate kinase
MLDVPHLSTGELLRESIRLGTEIGRAANEYMADGNLVPDELVIRMVFSRMQESDCHRGWLLDGFPRTVEQAQALHDSLQQADTPLDVVIELDIDRETIVGRLLKRAETESRDDDNYETIMARQQVYADQTRPVLDFYRERGLLRVVDGEGPAADVFSRIKAAISQLESGP